LRRRGRGIRRVEKGNLADLRSEKTGKKVFPLLRGDLFPSFEPVTAGLGFN
jgi:hypothetical protein